MPSNTDMYTALSERFLMAKTGSKTASQWNSFMHTYAPLVFPVLWYINSLNQSTALRLGYNPLMATEELDAIMLQTQINNLAIRTTISSIQINELRLILSRYTPLTKNAHQIEHIPQDIEQHGSVYAQWAFRLERTNKKLDDVNTNGKPGERERTALKARYRGTQVGLLHIQLEDLARTPAEKEFVAGVQPLIDSMPNDFKVQSRQVRHSRAFATIQKTFSCNMFYL